MTDLRTAAQQALEAIYGAKLCEFNSMSSRSEMIRLMNAAITILEAALAEPVQEPVAWIYADPDKFGVKFLEWREDAFGYEGEWTKTPLYTAPSQHKPLTDEEIHDCWQQRHRDKATERRLITRAIERAHGIVPSDCPDSHQPGCDRCRSPLWASTKCDVCGRKA